jgi:hypothetical protein
LARFVVAIVTFPLIGAYGWRWAGVFLQEVLAATGVSWGPVQGAFDIVGSLLGLGVGLWCAVQVVGCAFQSRGASVCAAGDFLLIVLGITFVADLVLIAALSGTPAAGFIPPANLAIWCATAAATFRLARLRRSLRRQRRLEETADAGPPASDDWHEAGA